MQVVVGSRALCHWINCDEGLSLREPSDTDIWITEDEKRIPEAGLDYVVMPAHIIDLVEKWGGYATWDAVYTIKCSHLGWDIFWNKHAKDVIMLKQVGCTLIPELYAALLKYWKETKGNVEYLSLKKPKDKFFEDNVTYVYDHDYLHKLVAFPNAPMYTHCLVENEEVLIDKDKFFAMPFEDQVRMFREEISVIAAERWLINPHWCGKILPYKAYKMALRKTTTTLTKNWATEFIVENFEYFVDYDRSYFTHLLNTLEEGMEILKGVASEEEKTQILLKVLEESVEEEYNVEKLAIKSLLESTRYKWHFENDNIKVLDHNKNTDEYGGHSYIVFQIDDTIYKLDYESGSFGDDINDVGELKRVELITKEVQVYE